MEADRQTERMESQPARQIAPPLVQVVIPALDEESTIGDVIKDLGRIGFSRVRVVDNGSKDRTAERAREAGAEVLVEPIPGYGRACWTGCLHLDPQVEWILFCDADGSDRLDDVPRLLDKAREADFILGNRRSRKEDRRHMTFTQNFGNGLATFLIRLGWGHRYYDLGPLRLIRRRLFESIGMRDRGFGWTLEMQVRAVEEGAVITEIPVGYRRRMGGRSKISGTLKGSVSAGVVILSTLGLLLFRRLVTGWKDRS